MSQRTHSGRARVELPGDEQILITRQFDAPRHLVYRAITEPELVRRWWPGHRGEMTIAEIDLRVGGRWRYVMTAHSSGAEVAFNGEYREIVPDERIVTTEIFEPFPDSPAVNTITLTDDGAGGTLMTVLVEHDSRIARDAHIASGMEDGMQESFDLLEQVAGTLG